MVINIQMSERMEQAMSQRMEQATTSHAADTASNSMTRGVKSGLCALLPFVIVVGGCSVGLWCKLALVMTWRTEASR